MVKSIITEIGEYLEKLKSLPYLQIFLNILSSLNYSSVG